MGSLLDSIETKRAELLAIKEGAERARKDVRKVSALSKAMSRGTKEVSNLRVYLLYVSEAKNTVNTTVEVTALRLETGVSHLMLGVTSYLPFKDIRNVFYAIFDKVGRLSTEGR